VVSCYDSGEASGERSSLRIPDVAFFDGPTGTVLVVDTDRDRLPMSKHATIG
jgi:hypothetical protein